MVTAKELIKEFEEKLERELKQEEVDFIKWVVQNQPHVESA